MSEQQTPETDDAFEDIFADGAEGDNEGTTSSQQNVEDKGDSLSLAELNKTFGREFKSKDEALKHAEHLKSFAGDQDAIKERKAQKELEEQKRKGTDALSRVTALEKDLAKERFLNAEQTAKPFLEPLEAYAEKNKMSLEEAWQSDAFKLIAETSQRVKAPTTNNRITPVQSKTIDKYASDIKETGSDDAKLALVKEYFKK